MSAHWRPVPDRIPGATNCRAELTAEFLPACDPQDVAARTEGFTPADLALAAQRAARPAFERVLSEGDDADVGRSMRRTGLPLVGTKPSVDADPTREFNLEESTYPRLS